MFVKISNTKYSVSEYGLIRNDKTNKILKIQDNGKGYKKVTLTNNGKPCQYYIHRLVAEYFLEKKSKDKLQVNHIDGNKSNNYFKNLEYVNNSENQIHAHKTGLKPNGDKLWNAKFSKEDIIKIKKLKECGLRQNNIAILMNTTKSTISEIISGKRYKYI